MPLWHIHTDRNWDRDRDWEQMGCRKLCGSFHITPELGWVLRPIVPHCSGSGPCTSFGLGSSHYEYTITSSGKCFPGTRTHLFREMLPGYTDLPLQGDVFWLHGLTSSGRCFPGMAETPVMKSWVRKVRMATECWQDGVWLITSRSKCSGTSTTGIWLNLFM